MTSPLAPPEPSSVPTDAPHHPPLSNHRLSLPYAVRLPALSATSFLVGGFLGSVLGGHRAALVFRAENAHRVPKSAKGWYFYHKTKNYCVAYGSVVEAIRTGAKVSVWVAIFVVFEDAVDRLRGRIDALNTVVAGLGVGGVFSVWHGLSYGLAVRTAQKGLVIGAGFGLAQDAIRCLKGQRGSVFEYLGLGAQRREAAAAAEVR